MIYQYRRKETITVTAGRKKKVIIGILVALCMTVTGCAGSVKKGTKYLEEKDYKNAEVEFQDAVDKKKNLGEAYRGLGLCYREPKKYEKAEKALEKALKNGTEETATLYNILGICDLELDKPEIAAEVEEQEDAFVIHLKSSCFSPFTAIEFTDADVILEDNFFHMTGGEEMCIRLEKKDIRSDVSLDAAELTHQMEILTLA